MKKKKFILILLLLVTLISVTGCSSSSPSDSRDWKKDAYEQGYYKGSDGKWYHK